METAMEDRDSATYSLESEPGQSNAANRISIDDVVLPTVRRSAIQIVSQPISPRRQVKKQVANATETMQITKLVLKTPPGSPKRQPKTPGIMIRSIQTLAGPALMGGIEQQVHDTVKQKPSILMDSARNVPEETVPYQIIPIVEPTAKVSSSRKEFEARRAERERTTNEFQDFLRDSFKENKTPTRTSSPLRATTISPAVKVTHITAIASSESESKSSSHRNNVATSSVLTNGISEIAIPVFDHVSTQSASYELVKSPPVPAARRSLLMANHNPPTAVQVTGTPVDEKLFNQVPLPNMQVPQPIVELNKPHIGSVSIASKPAAKSATTAIKEPERKKEKSYDPVRAREFIREQQAKRRQEKKETPGISTNGGTKSISEKDLIKQRLATLRQSSQKLVSKNLQKARTRSQSCASKAEDSSCKNLAARCAMNGPSEHQRLRPLAAKVPATNLRKFASTPTLRLNKHPLPDNTKQNNPIKPSGSSYNGVPVNLLNTASNATVQEKTQSINGKVASGSTSIIADKLQSMGSKIGILRKPDDLVLEDVVPFSPLKQESLIKTKRTQQVSPSPAIVNAQLIIINADEDAGNVSIAEAEKELKLEVPNVSLVPNSFTSQMTEKLSEGRPSQEQHHAQPIKTIPPWLKQSLRQPDPYPFIVAVRKKLEAVRSGRDEVRDEKKPAQMQSAKSDAYLDAIEKVPYIRKKDVQNIYRGNHAKPTTIQSNSSDIHADGSVIVTNISSCASSNTTSQISSIKSDIPPPMPPLLCSTRIELPNKTPIFPASPTVPVNGGVSPLSMERISQMKIASPQTSISRIHRQINGENQIDSAMLQLSQENVTLTSSIKTNKRASELPDRSQKELEYQRLLESFNRSLTHVIQVNHQLYSALKNVPAPTAVPPEILRIRDEMTQTSQPVIVIPPERSKEVAESHKTSNAVGQQPSQLACGTSTTASNYSDDFEHQSQTGDVPRTPERKLSPTTGATLATSSSVDSSASASSSSSSSSSSASNNMGSSAGSSATDNTSSDNSSSSSASSSSNEGTSVHNDQPQSQQLAQNRTNVAEDGRKKKTSSNTTTAHSSDFDSRSFSLSDSHNNTTNNHPPMPEEYLPSFEESLRWSKQSSGNIGSAANHQSVLEATREVTSTISERIARTSEERSFSLKHSEVANELKLDASLPLATDTDDRSSIGNNTLKDEPGCNARYPKEEINADTTVNSDLLAAIFNRTDLEVSILSATVSEANLSYSSIGMFDQLINSERSREDQLVSRVRTKQKSLLNRAKGQLAWLELQKQRYREKGMTEQISGIRKKQRAILLRLEKDQAELKRTIKTSTDSSPTITASFRTPLTAKNMDSKLNSFCSPPTLATGNVSGPLTLRNSTRNVRQSPQRQRRIHGSTVTTTTTTSNSIQIAIRGRELEPNDRLEDILLRREAELRKRKERVQQLVEWHRKLEREEDELLAVEGKLLAYNSRKLDSASTPVDELSIESRVQSIEKSLKTLQSIPTKAVDNRTGGQEYDKEAPDEEVVKTSGRKLNRLWCRLTGAKEPRYEPGRNYPITKAHLEGLFEDAKRHVLEGFQRNDGQLQETLLERSLEARSKSVTGEMMIAESPEENVSLQTMIEGDSTVQMLTEEEDKEKKHQKDEPDKDQPKITGTKQNELIENTESTATEASELPAGGDERQYMLFSSTVVNGWSPESRRSIESVEFHTLEETGTHNRSMPDGSVEEEPLKSESYSLTFEEHHSTVDGHGDHGPDVSTDQVALGEESQPMIEDMSLPSTMLNNTSVFVDEGGDEETTSSSCESSITVELSMPLIERQHEVECAEKARCEINEVLVLGGGAESGSGGQSLQEITESSVSTGVTTPTTVTPTSMTSDSIEDRARAARSEQKTGMEETKSTVEEPENTEGTGSDFEDDEEEEGDIFQLRSSRVSSRTGSPSSCASELEKRLATLHDELEELSETFERTPLMKSPTIPKMKTPLEDAISASSTSNSTEETITPEEEQEASSVSGGSKEIAQGEKGTGSSVVLVASMITVAPVEPPIGSKMEVMLRPKTTFCSHTSVEKNAIASGSGANNRTASSHQLAGETIGMHGALSPPLSPPAVVRMPDIINEAEVLRRQQLQIEQEIKELEQQVGFFREIPNKPPPPYIPPANGSPLALLFPNETRIDELIDCRVEELHRERIPPERLRSDHVTNVYEKLILDICKELYRELRPADPTVSFRTITHDKRPLVFFNPPDALRCMKDYLRSKIRRVLNEEQLALQQQHQHQQHQQQQQLLLHQHQLQQQQQHQQHSSAHVQLQQQQQHLLHHCATMPFLFANGGWCASRRKRDQVDEILAQEMHDDDARWTNFDREEIEVKDRITDELLKSLLTEAMHAMTEAFHCKANGGGKMPSGIRQESAM